MVFTTVVMREIDHDRAPLHAVARHVLDAEHVGARVLVGRPGLVALAALRDRQAMSRTVAVVEGDLRLSAAVGVEQAAHVREPVPLRRILQGEDHTVVARHVGEQRVQAVGQEVEAPAVLVAGRREDRRQAARIQDVAAGKVERQAEAERQAFLHLGDALQHLLRGDQIEAAELVVVAPVAPGRSFRTMLPALHDAFLPLAAGTLQGPPQRVITHGYPAQFNRRSRCGSPMIAGTRCPCPLQPPRRRFGMISG